MAVPPTSGEISYTATGASKFTFPTETETLSVKITPVPDAAGRTFIGNKYTIVIRSLIALFAADTDSTTDNKMDAIRRQLTTPGGAFVMTGKGVGDLQINVGGGKKDLAWGPFPRELEWKPEAGNRAGWIAWQVEFMTTDCSNARWAYDLMEFGYTMEITIGKQRLSMRNYSGHLRIPQNRIITGDKRLTDSVDLYYERIAPSIPLGYQRTNERRNIDESKCVLTFSFTDEQLILPLPAGIISCEVDHEQSNTAPMAFAKWGGQISARYEIAAHIPSNVTYNHFADLVVDRIVGAGVPWVPVTFSAHESIYARQMNYSLVYWYVLPFEAIVMSGFYRPVPFANHKLWALSMAYANVPRGYSQDVLGPGSDAIVDLCPPGVPRVRPLLTRPIGPRLSGPAGRVMKTKCPPPEASWLEYHNAITVSIDQGTVTHNPLPTKKLPEPQMRTVDPDQLLKGLKPSKPIDLTSTAGEAATRDPKAKTTQQQRTSPTVYIYLIGHGLRACYEVPAPVLQRVGNFKALPANREGVEFYTQSIFANAGVPIFGAKWSLRWLLTEVPRQPLASPKNPTASPKERQMKTVFDPNQWFGGWFEENR